MNSFKKSIDFLTKNILIIVPLFVAVLIPQLMIGNFFTVMSQMLTPLINEIMGGDISNPMDIVSEFMPQLMRMVSSMALAGGLSLLLTLVCMPITLGLIKRGIKNPPTGLQFIMDALKTTFVPYLLYYIAATILSIIIVIGLGIVGGLLSLLAIFLGGIGAVILAIAVIAAVILGIYFGFRLTLWLPAVILDTQDVIAALKKGFAASKGCFWRLFGMTLLIGIIIGVLTGITSLTASIPVLGSIIMAIVNTIGTIFITLFYMMFYDEKTQGAAAAPAA